VLSHSFRQRREQDGTPSALLDSGSLGLCFPTLRRGREGWGTESLVASRRVVTRLRSFRKELSS
jgi:hypothetical protein